MNILIYMVAPPPGPTFDEFECFLRVFKLFPNVSEAPGIHIFIVFLTFLNADEALRPHPRGRPHSRAKNAPKRYPGARFHSLLTPLSPFAPSPLHAPTLRQWRQRPQSSTHPSYPILPILPLLPPMGGG